MKEAETFTIGTKISLTEPSNYGGTVTHWYKIVRDEGDFWVQCLCSMDLSVHGVRREKLLRLVKKGAVITKEG